MAHLLPEVVHHWVTDTVLFVTVVALIGGTIITPAIQPILRRWLPRNAKRSMPAVSVYLFIVSGLLVSGLSHIFIDMLSAGTGGSPPLEPFWSVFEKLVSIDFIYYSSFTWNGGLLVVTVVVHLILSGLSVHE